MIYPNTELSLSVSSMLLRWRIVLMNFLMIVLHVFPAPSQKVVALRDVLCWIFVLMVVYVDVSPDISPNTLFWRSRIGQMRSTVLDPPSVCTMTSFFLPQMLRLIFIRVGPTLVSIIVDTILSLRVRAMYNHNRRGEKLIQSTWTPPKSDIYIRT